MHVLIVDDDQMVAKVIAECLAFDLGASVSIALTGTKALNACARRAPDVVLLDVELPDVSGLDLANRLIDISPNARIIVLSGYDAPRDRNNLPDGTSWLVKPVELDVLTEHILKTDSSRR